MSGNPAILLLLPGPKYRLEETLGPKLRLLSERFQGVVITTGDSARQFRIGNFLVISANYHSSAFREYWHFSQLVKKRLKDPLVIQALGELPLIVTYDPLRAGLVGLKVKRMIHAPLLVEVNGVFQSPANYIDIRNPLKRIIGRLRNMLVAKHVLKNADGIKTLFIDQLSGLYLPQPTQITASFFDWVPTAAFAAKNSSGGKSKTILFAGFPHFLKGVDLLIGAFKSLHPKHPEWRLKILGWYPDETIILKAIANHSAIEYHPPVLPPDMPKYIADCAIFVLPSRCEAMGRVLIETAAAGKARLASDVGGTHTVINDGQDGLLFRCGDQADLRSKLDQLMSDPDLRQQLGKQAKKRAEEHFDDQTYLSLLENFYTVTSQSNSANLLS